MKIDKNTLRLENDCIYLSHLRVKDITEEYINGLNDPEVNEYLIDVRQTMQTYESVKNYIILNMKDPASILFGIFTKEHKDPFIGTVRLHDIDFYHYSANIGICIFAKRAWKKGYALQAVNMVKEYLFKTHKLHYLEAGMYLKNIKSINLFTRAGFLEWYRVKDKLRHEVSFEETIYLAAINPSFDMSLLT